MRKLKLSMRSEGRGLGSADCRTPEGVVCTGRLVVGPHRLELQNENGQPLASTFVAWELVTAVCFRGPMWRVRLKPTPLQQVEMGLRVQDKQARAWLKQQLIQRCDLRRRWWSGWWVRKETI